MAKKQNNLTLEEKLQEALVADWEQPYAVPNNWVWTRLQNICLEKITDGTHQTPEYSNAIDGVAFLSAKDITTKKIDWSKNKYITQKLHKQLYERIAPQVNDILLAKNGTTGIAAIVDTNRVFSIYVTLALLRPNNTIILPNFLYYILNSPICKKQFDQRLKGIGVPNLHLRDIKEVNIPLPPLAEQERIVKRIESLFSKLDKAKELAVSALDSFENRKSAILYQAFTGELTKTWREQNNVSLDTWNKKEFKEIATVKSNLVNPLEFTQKPHIAPDNIQKKTGVLLKYNTIAEDGVTSGKHRFYAGQILYSKIRPYLSKVVVVDFDGLCSADMYPIEANENTKYLWYYMLSSNFLEQATTAGSRSVLPKINQKELSTITISMCSIAEQTEIVRILDSLLEKEQEAKALANVIKQTDHMKKAILARTFRGELDTNDPQEESALKLLKEILGNNS